MKIEFAGPQDEAAIKGLLAEYQLPSEDIRPDQLKHFLVLKDQDRLIGVIGLELYENTALLRSLAIREAYRKQGLAGELVERAEQHARASGVETLYLLTDTAERFLVNRGYQKTERSAAPAIIQQTTEFSSLCPLSSVCMTKNLSEQLTR
jgi:amino-acid N-acetyltransferase